MAMTRKMAAAASAAALVLGTCAAFPASAEIRSDGILLQAEAEEMTILSGGEATDKVYQTEYPGFSGTGFVWAGNSGGVTFDVDLKTGGTYELCSRCWMYLDGQQSRTQTVVIDGEKAAEVEVPNNGEWTDLSFGSFYLPAGKHTVELGGQGSYYFVLYDTVTFGLAKMPDLKIEPKLCDAKANAETKSLMQYLTSVYGKHILTGQQEIYGSGHDNNYELEFEYLKTTTGKYPAIRGFDFMNYNNLYGWDDNTTERVIEWAKERGGIATASWHLNVPKDFENYTLGDEVDWQACSYKNYQAVQGTFNTAKILEEGTKERAFFDANVKLLAEQLARLQDAGVPLIWRPLHEAQGNYGRYGDGTSWFWWGDRGPEVFKQLWALLYSELTETYGLHNLIWEMNMYEMDNSMEWYPGDEYVDILGYDKYEGSPKNWGEDPAASLFLTLVNDTADTKMVAMAECDKIPAIQGMENQRAMWLYICPWYFSGDTDANNSPQLLKDFYTSETGITLDELPADLYSGAEAGTQPAQTTAEAPETQTETTSSLQASKIGDVDENGSVNVGDAVLLARFCANDPTVSKDITAQGKLNGDVNRDGKTQSDDLTALLRKLARLD